MSESTECKKARTSSLRLFTRSNNNLTKSIKHYDAAEIVERKFEELSQKYSDVQNKHEEYILSIEDDIDFKQDECVELMDDVDETFSEAERMSHDYLKMKRNLKQERDHHLSEDLNYTAEATKFVQDEAVYKDSSGKMQKRSSTVPFYI